MESHIRIKFTANLTAIQQLDCPTYKILMYLAGRSNQYGTCFPFGVTIIKDTGICAETTYQGLEELVTYGYIKYLRQAYYNRFTGEKRPPLFQVSPHFLEIAEEFQQEAIDSWNNGDSVKPSSNQQQEPTTVNNFSIQQQETTTTTNNSSNETDLTAKRETQKTTAKPQAERLQRSLPNQNSAIVKKYTNPIIVTHPIEDLCEALAQNIAGIGIKIVLARGFIVQYGYADCELAYNHLQFLLTKQDITNPAAFYRYLLQSGMADLLPSMVEKKRDYTGKSYDMDAFIES